jgi:hypothetical protein
MWKLNLPFLGDTTIHAAEGIKLKGITNNLYQTHPDPYTKTIHFIVLLSIVICETH